MKQPPLALPLLLSNLMLSGPMRGLFAGHREDLVAVVGDSENEYASLLLRLNSKGISAIGVPEEVRSHYFFQPLSQGNWLAVYSRTRSDSEANATVFDKRGVVVRSFALGDGIEDVQATGGGEIWVSYFDEGVLNPGRDLGPSGVVCFSNDGLPVFKFSALPDVPALDDCYAMNVASRNDVWLYYYPDFPLVRLLDKQCKRAWSSLGVSGSSAFAIFRDRVAFFGSYDRDNTLFLVDLANPSCQAFTPVSQDGEPLVASYVAGRGPWLYIAADSGIYGLDIRNRLGP